MSTASRYILRSVPLSIAGAQSGAVLTRAATAAAVPLGIAALYYVGCLLGFALRFPSSGISFFWPPNAILLAGLLLVAPRTWPALLVTVFAAHGLAHARDGIPIAAWSIQYGGNASQALLGAWIVRCFGSVAIHESLRGALVFVAGACIVAPALASVAPSYVYVSLGWATDLVAAWRARSVTNAMATLAVVPSLLFSWRYLVQKPVLRASRIAEFGILLLGLLATLAVGRYFGRGGLLGLSADLYSITPFLIWAAVRFGGQGLSLALSATLLIVSKTATDLSPLAGGDAADAIVGVQLLLTATAVPLMLLAGLLQQQRAEHHRLVDVEHQNRAILRALPDHLVLHSRDGDILHSYLLDDVGHDDGAARRAIPPGVIADVVNAPSSAPGDEARVTEHTAVIGEMTRRYEARSVAVDDERWLTIIRDITDRWRSHQALLDAKQRYALAVGAGVIGVWDYDLRTERFHIEGTLKAALGYGEHEIRDTVSDWQSLIFEPDREEVRARMAMVASGAEPTVEVDFRMVHKDGSLRWISSQGAATEVIDGKPARIVGTYADVTEREQSARALRDANDTLVRLGRIAAMGEVTASIAHELNQPLTAIAANVLSCLRSLASQPEADTRDTLYDVLRDSQLARKIIERTQRLFANRPAQHSALNLNDVVRDVVKLAMPRLRALDARVRQDLELELPDVQADVVQIQQLLSNLILNAADALEGVPPERRLVRISTRHGKRHVIVSVRDSGEGLAQADISRLFEPFYTTKMTGTGMGLAISRSIVQSHGGTLWAVPNVDGGSTFRFKVPIPARSAAPDSDHSLNVLVVDDHVGVRTALTRLLTGGGHRVAIAANGAHAMAVVQTFRPDVVVIDMSLGDMTGVELARRLRSMPADQRPFLIALTAQEGDEVRQECVAAGFDVYLVKQKQLSELEVVLRSVRQ